MAVQFDVVRLLDVPIVNAIRRGGTTIIAFQIHDGSPLDSGGSKRKVSGSSISGISAMVER